MIDSSKYILSNKVVSASSAHDNAHDNASIAMAMPSESEETKATVRLRQFVQLETLADRSASKMKIPWKPSLSKDKELIGAIQSLQVSTTDINIL